MVLKGGETSTVIDGYTVVQTVHPCLSPGALQRRDMFERVADQAPLSTACNGRQRTYAWRGEDLILACERLGSALTAQDVAAWCVGLCAQCSALHRRGIVHGDIKPENVCTNPNTGAVSLIDFGAAMWISDEGAQWLRGRDPRRVQGAIVGTTEYTVPLQRAKSPVDIDYYATGRTIAALQGALAISKRDPGLCRIGRELEACGERAAAGWRELAALKPAPAAPANV
jgi:serine/threonine protein kinase